MSRPIEVATSPLNFALSPLAAAIGFALTAAPLAVQAQTAPNATAPTEPRQLSKLIAKPEEDSIKADQSASTKFTQPLLDTPQTITVVTQETLRQQGAGTLIEALANTPGITLQLGENGNTSAGDTFSMRGSSSQTNIFVDGIRDLGAITRDTFTTEQVEIAKGAVGADYGRGATAGYINVISKLPRADDFGAATFSLNSVGSPRLTTDLNKQFSDSGALRLNAMWQNGDVAGRNFVENNRWGVAPAFALGLNTPTRFYLYSQHVRSSNVPDGGLPTIGLPGFYNESLAAAGIHPAAVASDNFYGRHDDFEDTRADMGTLRIEHDFNDGFSLFNTTRYGSSDMQRVMTGINTLTVSGNNPDQWSISRTRQVTYQENKLLTNQTSMNFRFRTAVIEHDVASGLEFIQEQQYSPTWAGFGTRAAVTNLAGTTISAAINLPNANLYNPDPYFAYLTAYAPAPTGAYSDGQTTTYAAYAFDTLKLTEQVQVTAGARLEHYETAYDALSISTANVVSSTDLNKSGNLLSWKTGVVFKPLVNGSLYLAYSNSLRPPGGDNFTLSTTTSNNNNNLALDPQETTNLELGTKWDLLNARLALTAALYRTEIKNGLQQLDAASNEYVQYGNRRLQGAEFGVVGKITANWQMTAGLAWSDNEQIEGTTSTNANTQDLAGSTARWAPEYSANLWTTYSLSRWSAGLGANYVSEQKRITNPDVDPATQAGLAGIPGYTVFNGMLSYAVTENLGLQLNAYNLLDKTYISSLNNGGSRLRLGAPRYAQLTVNFKF